MLCNKCGAPNGDEAKTCNACGADLNLQKQQEANGGQNVQPQVVYVSAPGEDGQMQSQPQIVYYINPPKPTVPGRGMAIASLVLGILAIVCGGLVQGILAVVFGVVAKKKGYKDAMATTGIVLGILGIVFWIVLIIMFWDLYATLISTAMSISQY